jgi:hypothetical protein
MSLWKQYPKGSPTHFWSKFMQNSLCTVEKSRPKICWLSYKIFKKLPKTNNNPRGENKPNLVTLCTDDDNSD